MVEVRTRVCTDNLTAASVASEEKYVESVCLFEELFLGDLILLPELTVWREYLLSVTLRSLDMEVNHLHPLSSCLLVASLEPELAIVALDRNHKLFSLALVMRHKALVEVKIENSCDLLHPIFLLKVLQNTISEVNLARLPPLENCRAVFF